MAYNHFVDKCCYACTIAMFVCWDGMHDKGDQGLSFRQALVQAAGQILQLLALTGPHPEFAMDRAVYRAGLVVLPKC